MDAVLRTARPLAEQLMRRWGDTFYDGSHLIQAVAVGLMVGQGAPTDKAVSAVVEAMMRGLVIPAPENPMYHGLPWMVPGPASGAPYYTR